MSAHAASTKYYFLILKMRKNRCIQKSVIIRAKHIQNLYNKVHVLIDLQINLLIALNIMPENTFFHWKCSKQEGVPSGIINRKFLHLLYLMELHVHEHMKSQQTNFQKWLIWDSLLKINVNRSKQMASPKGSLENFFIRVEGFYQFCCKIP